MKFNLKELIITAVIYLTIDIVYITSSSRRFKKYFKYLQNAPLKFKQMPAVITYTLLTLGLYYFIIKDKRPVLDAFLLGILIYGVYDFTNYATLQKWTLAFSVTDMLWGGVVFALSTYIIYKVIDLV